ncbi:MULTISPECIES: putative hydro-lyase [unclassified Acidovorax]|uniref:putative hydro-lyase n=1 Tax=unclassified Acidovorax TaxID=2684926 RepID=UPI0028834552|nr:MULTISPECIES: putative hydro-lyase [unclassified Acidovorax]
MGAEGINDPAHVRSVIRQGAWSSHTSGLAHGRVQGNLVILPEALAGDFLRYCQRNPKPCPVLAVSEPGQTALPTLGHDIDIRSDLPQYRVWRHGKLVQEVSDVSDLWRPDLVTFILGCSFSFESALVEAGISLRHIDEGKNVAMYRTNISTEPAGPFGGAMVVSMRPMPAADVIRAVQVTSRFPNVHGAPVHIGDPSLIGIADLGQPDYGDAVSLLPGDIPVFWACGVTPQSAILNARPDFCITHSPGCMLITDLLNHQLASL